MYLKILWMVTVKTLQDKQFSEVLWGPFVKVKNVTTESNCISNEEAVSKCAKGYITYTLSLPLIAEQTLHLCQGWHKEYIQRPLSSLWFNNLWYSWSWKCIPHPIIDHSFLEHNIYQCQREMEDDNNNEPIKNSLAPGKLETLVLWQKPVPALPPGSHISSSSLIHPGWGQCPHPLVSTKTRGKYLTWKHTALHSARTFYRKWMKCF